MVKLQNKKNIIINTIGMRRICDTYHKYEAMSVKTTSKPHQSLSIIQLSYLTVGFRMVFVYGQHKYTK